MKAFRGAIPLLAAVLLLAGCHAPVVPRVTLGGQRIEPYLADTMAERSKGLQGFDGLAEGEAMVFVYPNAAVRTFGMKGVGFPIDIAFIGTDNTVSEIVSLDPGDTTKVSSPGPCRYVVELPRGWAAKHGIGVGSAFTYETGR